MRLEQRIIEGHFGHFPDEVALEVPYTLIACETPDHELLMLRRQKKPFPGLWNFIGGKIEPDEPPDRSALRELFEEAGISLKLEGLAYRGIAAWPDEASGKLMGMYLFHAKLGRRYASRQMRLFEEGLMAWLPIASLSHEGAFQAVPNFSVLLPTITDEARRATPKLLLHWRLPDHTYGNAHYPFRVGLGPWQSTSHANRVMLNQLVDLPSWKA